MENKKINVIFGLIIIIFIAFYIVMIKDFDAQRVRDLKYYSTAINNIIIDKNIVIGRISNQLVRQEKENQDLRNYLSDTRNALESLSKKLVQPVAGTAPASEPLPVAAAK